MRLRHRISKSRPCVPARRYGLRLLAADDGRHDFTADEIHHLQSSCSGGQRITFATPSDSRSSSWRATCSGVPINHSFGSAAIAVEGDVKSSPSKRQARAARSSISDRSLPQTTPARTDSANVAGSRSRRSHALASAFPCPRITSAAPAATLYSSVQRAARSRLRGPPLPPSVSLGRVCLGFGRGSLWSRR